MMSITFYNLFRLLFGTLYPAYASYKAVKTKNVKEYVKWMMYWIVFAFFTCIETFADIFIAWVPFYYELKILFVLWLLSPATKGSSILYRKLVHPQLSKREKDIDSYINKASDQGYSAILSVGSKSISYASNMLLSTAIKGQTKLVDQLKKSYSLSDVSNMNEQDQVDYAREDLLLDDETDNLIIEDSYCEEMKIDRPERVKKDKNAKEKHRGDNRLIEEQYQREMMEKENLGGGRDKPHKRRTNLNQQEISQDDGEVTVRRTNKTNYNHKEVEPPRLQRPLSYPGHHKGSSKPKSAYVSPLVHSMMSYNQSSSSSYVSPYLSSIGRGDSSDFEEYEYKSKRSGSVSSVSSESSTISQASSYRSTSSRPSLSRRESDVSPRRSSASEERAKSTPKYKIDMSGSKSPSTWRHRVNASESKK